MIQQELIDQILDRATKEGVSRELLSTLKEENPALLFQSEDDDNLMESKPVASTDTFHLYLIDTQEHCLTLTRDLERAGGFLFGIRGEDEED